MRKSVAVTLAACLLVSACAGQPAPTQPVADVQGAAAPAVEIVGLDEAVGPDGNGEVRLTYRTQGLFGDIVKVVTAPVRAAGSVVGGALGVIKDDVLDPLFGDLGKLGAAALKHVPILKAAFKAVNRALGLVDKALSELKDVITGSSGAARRGKPDPTALVATLTQLDRAVGKLQAAMTGVGRVAMRSRKFQAPIAQIAGKVQAIADALPAEVSDDPGVKAQLRRLRLGVAELRRRTGLPAASEPVVTTRADGTVVRDHRRR